MNSKIKNYVDVIFQEVPRSKKAIELKEEITSNLSERFEDYLKQGKSETESYGLAIANMGDVDEMIREVMPSETFFKEANTYRKRNARNTAISVSLYIIGAAILILASMLGEILGFKDSDIGPMVGVVALLVLTAIATALLIYTNMSTPKEYKDYEDSVEKEILLMRPQDRKIYEAITSIYWLICTTIYLLVSFITGFWHITWIIWPVAGILHEIISTIFQLKGIKE